MPGHILVKPHPVDNLVKITPTATLRREFDGVYDDAADDDDDKDDDDDISLSEQHIAC